MASNLSTEDYLAFSEGLQQYQYINDQGRLDLEDFCVTLAACIHHDGIGFRDVARPIYFHNLLVKIIRDRAPQARLDTWIQYQNLVDWTPKHVFLYPEKRRTYIHIAALVNVSHDWIALIGKQVLNIPEAEWRPEYFGWAKESWDFTHSFLSGFHNALYTLAKKIDLKHTIKGESSSFEALDLSLRNQIDFDDAKKYLIIRNKVWKAAENRINRAIEDKYFLEAITLSENLISNLLFNFIPSKSTVSSDLSFHNLIQKTSALLAKPEETDLLSKVDQWRRGRNSAIHNFIGSSIDDLTAKTETLDAISEKTAKEGQELANRMLDWYRNAAVDFIQHNFPRVELNS